MYRTDLIDDSKSNDIVTDQKNDENKLVSSTVIITKPFHNESEKQCSKNSIVRLEENKVLSKPIHTIRKTFCSASIFNYDAVTKTKLFSNKDDDQKYKDPTIDNSCHAHWEKPINSYDTHTSNIISETMKIKMLCVLNKHRNGILCNNFTDVYNKEYKSHFHFSKYGFSSMKDMAFHLPSVFYLKLIEDGNECILFEASTRTKLENKLNDSSMLYTNIPKAILRNFSQFFDMHRTGVDLNEMMILYCSKYGRFYEPLKYGYSSEKHMFESLDKMVEIKNNVLFTKDPFAYTQLLKTINPIDTNEKTALVLPGDDFLLNYSNNDICNGRFKYYKIKLNDQKLNNVIVAEVYNPSSFYVQLAEEVKGLNKFMDKLQEFYNENEEKYKVSSKLILPELPCISCVKDTKLWHRAKVLKIVDEENVQLFFVDYGSIEIVPKINIRLLQSRFSTYVTQALHCGLYKCIQYNYSREISESFADMVEHQVLKAQVHPSIPENDSGKIMVTLFLNTKYDQVNINKRISEVLANVRHSSKYQKSFKR